MFKEKKKKVKNDVYKVVALVLILDQLVKIIIKRSMNLYQEIAIIPKFFSLCYVQNTGAAFSILEDATLFLLVVSVIFIILIDNTVKKEYKNLSKLAIISTGMILGGIFGNLIDRILYRSVIDFISFSFGSYHFPIFNIADIGITVGMVLLIIDMIKNKDQKNKEDSHD